MRTREDERAKKQWKEHNAKHRRYYNSDRRQARDRAKATLSQLVELVGWLDDEWILDVVAHNHRGRYVLEALLMVIVEAVGMESIEKGTRWRVLERIVAGLNKGLVDAGEPHTKVKIETAPLM